MPELEKLKMLLGIQDAAQNGVLSFALETVTEMALGYCCLKEVPPGMKNLLVRMAADLYRQESYGQSAVPQTAQSVTRGDVTVSFGSGGGGSGAELSGGKSLLENYRAQLNAFRRLRG